MREIKFRAWDTTKQMMTGSPFALTNNCEYPWMLVRDYANGGWKGEATSRFIPMQFTGLKDKNGKEIYEGDIFEFDYPMEVLWDMGSWVVKTKKGSSLLFGYTTEGEIIGNIYENPELLDNPKSK